MFLSGTVGLAHGQSLDDLLVAASENNPGLQARYAEFEAAMQQVPGARALQDPVLSFGYFVSPVETRVGPQQVKIGLSQMFPWFGTLAAQGDQATRVAEARYQEFLDVKNELAYRVKEAWYPLYELDRHTRLQRENLVIVTAYLRLATAAFENGEGTMVDVIRADIMAENVETDIRLLQDKMAPLLVRLNSLLNRADTTSVTIPDSIPAAGTVYQSDSLLTVNPVMKAYDLRLRAAQAREVAARKQGLPRFGVGLDYVVIGESDMEVTGNGRDAWMPMVSMSLPIYRGRYRAAVKEAQFTQSAIASAKEDFGNHLSGTWAMTRYEMDRAFRLMALYREQEIKTRQALNLLLAAYRNAGNDFEEVLQLQQELLKYRMAGATALKDYHTASAKLEYLGGGR